jgi:hypothetical protein
MKYLSILFLICLFSCKDEPKLDSPKIINKKTPISLEVLNDSILILDKDLKQNKEISIKLKQKKILEKIDERNELQKLIIEKQYFKEENAYTLDFTYPLLDVDFKPTNANFNDYINNTYIDITGTVDNILQDNVLICDSITTTICREKRYIDYKIYNVNNQLVSILFYKENFYSGTLHPTYTFDCMNFDLNRGVFLKYEDFFISGSEEEFTDILNEEITKQIMTSNLYYDC